MPTLAESAARATHPRRRDRATHMGSCQVCGRLQKLPSGVLSKHGYTKRWGFFMGTCPGAHYRPFEQAFDRVQNSIDQTKGQVRGFKTEIYTLQTSPITDKAPFHAYDRTGRRGYYETEVTVSLEPIPGSDRTIVRLTEIQNTGILPKVEIKHHGSQHGLFGTIEDAVKKLRESRITRINREIEQRERYIAWQERRIREWKPCPLQPVKESL